MKLSLLDSEHAVDPKGNLWVKINGKWTLGNDPTR